MGLTQCFMDLQSTEWFVVGVVFGGALGITAMWLTKR